MHDYAKLTARITVINCALIVLLWSLTIITWYWQSVESAAKPAAGDMLPACMIQVEDY